MPVSAAQATWAARSGLLLALFIYLVGDGRKRNDNPFTILVFLAATFLPAKDWHAFKLCAIGIARNVAFALLWMSIAFSAAAAAITINEDVLPYLGWLLRNSELSAAWPVGFILLTILANIPWKAFFHRLGIMLEFQQQYAQPA